MASATWLVGRLGFRLTASHGLRPWPRRWTGLNSPTCRWQATRLDHGAEPTERERAEWREVERWLANFNVANIPRSTLDGLHPPDHVRLHFARSRGPGGQNVNKVNSKAEIRFDLDKAHWLPEYTRRHLRDQQAHRINKDGELIIASERNRTQSANVEDCFAKLHEMIVAASATPREPTAETRERVKALQHKEDARRREEKRRRSAAKTRRNGGWDD